MMESNGRLVILLPLDIDVRADQGIEEFPTSERVIGILKRGKSGEESSRHCSEAMVFIVGVQGHAEHMRCNVALFVWRFFRWAFFASNAARITVIVSNISKGVEDIVRLWYGG